MLEQLQNFKIPKQDETGLLSAASPYEKQQLLESTFKSYLWDYSTASGWKPEEVKIVHNRVLEEQYRCIRDILSLQCGRKKQVVECTAYLAVADPRQVCCEGLRCQRQGPGSSPLRPGSSPLGHHSMGAHLFLHPDVALEAFKNLHTSNAHIVVFQVVRGRAKSVVPCLDNNLLEPTPNYNSHLSSLKPSPRDSVAQAIAKSQVYIYHYDEDGLPTERLKQCKPVALITMKKVASLARTPTGPPLAPSPISTPSKTTKPIRTAPQGTDFEMSLMWSPLPPSPGESLQEIISDLKCTVTPTKTDLPSARVVYSCSPASCRKLMLKDPRLRRTRTSLESVSCTPSPCSVERLDSSISVDLESRHGREGPGETCDMKSENTNSVKNTPSPAAIFKTDCSETGNNLNCSKRLKLSETDVKDSQKLLTFEIKDIEPLAECHTPKENETHLESQVKNKQEYEGPMEMSVDAVDTGYKELPSMKSYKDSVCSSVDTFTSKYCSVPIALTCLDYSVDTFLSTEKAISELFQDYSVTYCKILFELGAEKFHRMSDQVEWDSLKEVVKAKVKGLAKLHLSIEDKVTYAESLCHSRPNIPLSSWQKKELSLIKDGLLSLIQVAEKDGDDMSLVENEVKLNRLLEYKNYVLSFILVPWLPKQSPGNYLPVLQDLQLDSDDHDVPRCFLDVKVQALSNTTMFPCSEPSPQSPGCASPPKDTSQPKLSAKRILFPVSPALHNSTNLDAQPQVSTFLQRSLGATSFPDAASQNSPLLHAQHPDLHTIETPRQVPPVFEAVPQKSLIQEAPHQVSPILRKPHQVSEFIEAPPQILTIMEAPKQISPLEETPSQVLSLLDAPPQVRPLPEAQSQILPLQLPPFVDTQSKVSPLIKVQSQVPQLPDAPPKVPLPPEALALVPELLDSLAQVPLLQKVQKLQLLEAPLQWIANKIGWDGVNEEVKATVKGLAPIHKSIEDQVTYAESVCHSKQRIPLSSWQEKELSLIKEGQMALKQLAQKDETENSLADNEVKLNCLLKCLEALTPRMSLSVEAPFSKHPPYNCPNLDIPPPQEATLLEAQPQELSFVESVPQVLPVLEAPYQKTVNLEAPLQVSTVSEASYQAPPLPDAPYQAPPLPEAPYQAPPLPEAPYQASPQAPLLLDAPQASPQSPLLPDAPYQAPPLPEAPYKAPPLPRAPYQAPPLPEAPYQASPQAPLLPDAPPQASPQAPLLAEAPYQAPPLPEAPYKAPPQAPLLPDAPYQASPQAPLLPDAPYQASPQTPLLPDAPSKVPLLVEEPPQVPPLLKAPLPTALHYKHCFSESSSQGPTNFTQMPHSLPSNPVLSKPDHIKPLLSMTPENSIKWPKQMHPPMPKAVMQAPLSSVQRPFKLSPYMSPQPRPRRPPPLLPPKVPRLERWATETCGRVAPRPLMSFSWPARNGVPSHCRNPASGANLLPHCRNPVRHTIPPLCLSPMVPFCCRRPLLEVRNNQCLYDDQQVHYQR